LGGFQPTQMTLFGSGQSQAGTLSHQWRMKSGILCLRMR
jgi:hypothetical protein